MFDDPYIRLIAEALIKTAASKTIDFSLSGISLLLKKAVQDGDQASAIRIIESDESIKEPALKLANEALASSFLVPIIPENKITADEALDLFMTLIDLGFRISRKLNCDICFPGSIIDVDTITLFTSENKNLPLLEKKDRLILIPFEPGSEIGIYPAADPLKLSHSMMEVVRSKREVSTSYVKLSGGPFMDGVMVKSINLQNVSFSTLNFNKDFATQLKMSGGSVKIRNWGDGINAMLDFIPEIPDLDALSLSSTEQLIKISKKIDALAKNFGKSN